MVTQSQISTRSLPQPPFFVRLILILLSQPLSCYFAAGYCLRRRLHVEVVEPFHLYVQELLCNLEFPRVAWLDDLALDSIWLVFMAMEVVFLHLARQRVKLAGHSSLNLAERRHITKVLSLQLRCPGLVYERRRACLQVERVRCFLVDVSARKAKKNQAHELVARQKSTARPSFQCSTGCVRRPPSVLVV